MLTLFDDVIRNNFGPAEYAEPIFTFLNRTARVEFDRIRQELEKWFSHYSTSEQAELRAHFRSSIDSQHQAAFFELFLHELLIKMGCKITVHPVIPTVETKPDFLVEAPNEDPFYVEATIATNQSKEDASANARVNVVYDVLNRVVDSPNFFLWLKVRGAPETPPPAKKLGLFINRRLAKLDLDEIERLRDNKEFDAIPRWNFNHDGWKIEIEPIPKSLKTRGKPGIRPIGAKSTGFQRMDSAKPIKDSIVDKAGRYGELGLPYIIAVNILEHSDETDIMNALFGTERYVIDWVENEPKSPSRMSRARDGIWIGPNGHSNTRVSAVLLANQLSYWTISKVNLRLYHNPWAQQPYHSILNHLPQSVPIEGQMKHVEGKSSGEILNLSSTWPESTEEMATL